MTNAPQVTPEMLESLNAIAPAGHTVKAHRKSGFTLIEPNGQVFGGPKPFGIKTPEKMARSMAIASTDGMEFDEPTAQYLAKINEFWN